MKRLVRVTQIVEVEVDETKFTPEFMGEFRTHLYPFTTLDEHVSYLGQLCARGLLPEFTDSFVEGYGTVYDMGVRVRVIGDETEIEFVSPESLA